MALVIGETFKDIGKKSFASLGIKKKKNEILWLLVSRPHERTRYKLPSYIILCAWRTAARHSKYRYGVPVIGLGQSLSNDSEVWSGEYCREQAANFVGCCETRERTQAYSYNNNYYNNNNSNNNTLLWSWRVASYLTDVCEARAW